MRPTIYKVKLQDKKKCTEILCWPLDSIGGFTLQLHKVVAEMTHILCSIMFRYWALDDLPMFVEDTSPRSLVLLL